MNHPPAARGGQATPEALAHLASDGDILFIDFLNHAKTLGYHVSNEWDAEQCMPVIYRIQ